MLIIMNMRKNTQKIKHMISHKRQQLLITELHCVCKLVIAWRQVE